MTYNPFETTRINKRIADLVRERDEALTELKAANKELNHLKTLDGFYRDVERVNVAMKDELQKIKLEHEQSFSSGYNQAVWDITHFLTDKQKEIDKIKEDGT